VNRRRCITGDLCRHEAHDSASLRGPRSLPRLEVWIALLADYWLG